MLRETQIFKFEILSCPTNIFVQTETHRNKCETLMKSSIIVWGSRKTRWQQSSGDFESQLVTTSSDDHHHDRQQRREKSKKLSSPLFSSFPMVIYGDIRFPSTWKIPHKTRKTFPICFIEGKIFYGSIIQRICCFWMEKGAREHISTLKNSPKRWLC